MIPNAVQDEHTPRTEVRSDEVRTGAAQRGKGGGRAVESERISLVIRLRDRPLAQFPNLIELNP